MTGPGSKADAATSVPALRGEGGEERPMFGSFPDWSIAVWAVILAMLVGTWAYRPAPINLDRSSASVCERALVDVC
jgi:hypothetical protein